MAEIKHRFETKDKAEGFSEGVQYVNDSALEFSHIDHEPEAKEPWVVIINDSDL